MAVSTAYSPLTYSGNGATTAFSVTWPFFSGTLVVTLISSTGVETARSLTTHYTVSGGTDANGLPATGTVTMLTAPASGETLRITRSTSKTQATAYAEADAFPAKTMEAALDKLTLIAQEGGSAGTVNDGISGDVMELVTSGATDYWDAESQIIRNVAAGTASTDAVNKAQLDAASTGGGLSLSDTAFLPVVQPSSTNLQGSGYPNGTHQLLWSDSNIVQWMDNFSWNCSDPSALDQIVISNAGARLAGDVNTLTWYVSGVPTSVTYTCVGAGESDATVATGLVNAVIASSLYNPVTATNTGGGGYANSKPIGFITSVGATIYYDHDSRLNISLATSVTGGGARGVITPSIAHPSLLSKEWDANPLMLTSRVVAGVAPPTGSNIWSQIHSGGTSTSPSAVAVQYGGHFVQVLSSTTGALSARYQFLTCNTAGALAQGMYLGAGLYGISTTGGDKGADSLNFTTIYQNNVQVATRTGSETLTNKTLTAPVITGRDFADYRRSADQSVVAVATPTEAKIQFNTSITSSSNFDASTNYRYTVPTGTSGRYLITLAADITVGATATFIAVYIKKNGTTVSQRNFPAIASGINYTFDLTWIDGAAVATDYYEAFVYCTESITIEGGTVSTTRLQVKELVG